MIQSGRQPDYTDYGLPRADYRTDLRVAGMRRAERAYNVSENYRASLAIG
jgi:hypothetical protein